MRLMTSAVLALMLSGCGGDGDDFSVYVKRSPEAALSSLTAIDVNGPSAFADKPISRTLSDGGIIEYALPASSGYSDGIVRLTVSGNEKQGTKVAVMVDVPAIEHAGEVVAEDKVERVLKDDLQAWAKSLETGSSASYETARIEGTLNSVAFVLQNMEGGGRIEKAAVAGSGSFFDSGSGDEDWAASEPDLAYNDGSPMSDPEDDASSYGEPMDDAAGSSDDDGWGN